MNSPSLSVFLFALLQLLGLAASARLDTLGNRSVDMVVRDPGLVVLAAFRSGQGDARGLGSRERGIGGGGDVDLLGLLAGTGGATLRGGEEGFDPGLVDKVESASEGASEDEVEEDAARFVSRIFPQELQRSKSNISTKDRKTYI